MQLTKSHTKLFFEIEIDASGYPPVATESVWALSSTEYLDGYVIDSIPFFAREATLGDTVRGVKDNGVLWFREMINPSRNSLIRVVFFDKKAVLPVRNFLKENNCDSELDENHSLISVNVPCGVSIEKIRKYLKAHCDLDEIDYEEPILRY